MHGGYWKHMVADRVLQAAALLCLSYREGIDALRPSIPVCILCIHLAKNQRCPAEA